MGNLARRGILCFADKLKLGAPKSAKEREGASPGANTGASPAAFFWEFNLRIEITRRVREHWAGFFEGPERGVRRASKRNPGKEF